jgi:hypothetical protein
MGGEVAIREHSFVESVVSCPRSWKSGRAERPSYLQQTTDHGPLTHGLARTIAPPSQPFNAGSRRVISKSEPRRPSRRRGISSPVAYEAAGFSGRKLFRNQRVEHRPCDPRAPLASPPVFPATSAFLLPPARAPGVAAGPLTIVARRRPKKGKFPRGTFLTGRSA